MVEGQEGVTWPQWKAIAAACELYNVPALFRSDHLLPLDGHRQRGALEAWGTLCGLAAITTKLQLGTLVSPVTFRHPGLLAKMVVTADHISGGRIELGLGAGWYEEEHRAFGLSLPRPEDRLSLLEEQLAVIRGLLCEDDLEHSGPNYTLRNVSAHPRPMNAAGIPIIVGGSGGHRSATLAAREAHEYNTLFATPAECATRRATLTRACLQLGRDPASLRFSLMTGSALGRNGSEVEERLRLIGNRLDRPNFKAPEAWLAGTVDQVLSQLRTFQEVGVDRIMIQVRLHEQLDQIALVGELAQALSD